MQILGRTLDFRPPNMSDRILMTLLMFPTGVFWFVFLDIVDIFFVYPFDINIKKSAIFENVCRSTALHFLPNSTRRFRGNQDEGKNTFHIWINICSSRRLPTAKDHCNALFWSISKNCQKIITCKSRSVTLYSLNDQVGELNCQLRFQKHYLNW